MTLGEDLAAALPELQAAAESMMVDTCTVRRPTGTGADPETGADITTYREPAIYSGPCRLQIRQGQPRDLESGSSTQTVQLVEVHVPAAAGPFAVGDVVEVSRPGSTPRRLRIDGLHEKTYQTAQRLPAVDVSSRAVPA